MRRIYEYAAMTKDECNAADGRFPTDSWCFLVIITTLEGFKQTT
jgi:hypothetical protein